MIRTEGKSGAVWFQRHPELAGVEVRHEEDSAPTFCAYSPEFELMTTGGWHGEVRYRRRTVRFGPSSLVCAEPGDVLIGRASAPGSRTTLRIEREVLAASLEEHGISSAAMELRWHGLGSPRLLGAVTALARAVGLATSAPAPGVLWTELMAVLAEELTGDATWAHVEESSDRRAAERVHECLHHDLSASVDLATVARQTGMSRFCAVRVFKRWYGLPPCAYQRQVRLGLVQRSLRQGMPPAEAAVTYGFVDQSHLTRHFRRALGVTPARYARPE